MKPNKFFYLFLFLLVLPIVYSTTSGSHDVSVAVQLACFGNDTSCGTSSCINCNSLDGFYDGNFCSEENVVKESRDYYCDAFECGYTSTNPIIENCTSGCNEDTGNCQSNLGSNAGSSFSTRSGLELSVSELLYSEVIIPSTPDELSSITLSVFSVDNKGTEDTEIRVQFSCDQYNFCSAHWCQADRNQIPLAGGESVEIEIFCLIPEDIEPETDYKMDVFISNTFGDSSKVTVTLPTSSQSVIGVELAKRERRRQVKTTTAGVGTAVIFLGSLWFMFRPVKIKKIKRR